MGRGRPRHRSDDPAGARGVVRDAARPTTPSPSCGPRASRPRRWCRRTRRSTTRRCGPRGFFEPIEQPVVGAQRLPDVAGAACRPARRATGAARRRRSAQHTDDVLRAELGVDDAELARLRERARHRHNPEIRIALAVTRVSGVLEREEPELDALDGADRGRARRRRRRVPAGHRAGRAAAPQLPHRLLRHVRVEHRHVDAERRARRLRATS